MRENLSEDHKDLTLKFTPLSRYDFDMGVVDNWCEIRAKSSPRRRCNQSCFIYQNEFYVFGGTDISETKIADLYKIHLQDAEIKWIELKPSGTLPEPIAYHSGTLYKDKYYVIGGENNYKVTLRTLYIYDIKENKWDQKNISDSCFPAVESHSAILYEDDLWPKIYIFGGYSKGKFCNDIFTYDIYKEEWKKIERLNDKVPEPRIAHSVTMYKGNMYIFGGKTQDAKHLNDLWMYNIKDNVWTQIIPKGENPKGRSGHSMINFKDRIYIFGGKVGSIHEINEFLVYYITTNELKLIHDTLLEQYSEKELNQINVMKHTVVEDKKVTKKIKKSPSKKELKPNTKDGNLRKSNYGSGFQNKLKYEEELMQSPNSKAMKNSYIYKMDITENNTKTKMTSILLKNKTLKITKLFGSVPMPRDGHSSLLYFDTMIIFGGDRNKFPLNDLFIYHLDNQIDK